MQNKPYNKQHDDNHQQTGYIISQLLNNKTNRLHGQFQQLCCQISALFKKTQPDIQKAETDKYCNDQTRCTYELYDDIAHVFSGYDHLVLDCQGNAFLFCNFRCQPLGDAPYKIKNQQVKKKLADDKRRTN